MADQPVRWTPLGNLDKDTEYKLVGKGNYTDALDVIKQDDDGQVSGTIQPTKRNKHAFSLGSVQAQNKKYRVTVSGDATKSHALKFLSTKRDYRSLTGTGTNGEVEFDGTISSLISAINAADAFGVYNVTQSGNEATITMTAYNYYQWYLESVGDDDVEVVCIQEAIPTDLAGPLKDIGSYDLLGDLFVFSTTQDNEPQETDLQILGVGPVSGGQFVGPITEITFTSDHNLQLGQWIRITDSEQSWQNGLFVVQTIPNSTTIGIVTNTAWGQTYPTGPSGGAVITVNPNGIGEIGVAVKDKNTDSWSYTSLLRSVELGFVSKNEIDCRGERNQERVSFYYDDDYNPSRVFYYYGEFQQEGAINAVNSNNKYRYEFISRQSYGYTIKPSGLVRFVEQQTSGGNCPSGNIRYFYILQDHFGNWTKPSDLSPFVITYSDLNSGLALGDSETTTTTNKVNVMSVVDIDTAIYNKVRLGYYTEIEGVKSAFLLNEVTLSGRTQNLLHNGFCEEETYDVGELAVNFITGYDYAKSIEIIDNRLVRSNLRKKDLLDLREWAATFKHRIVGKRERATSYNSPANEYQSPDNGFNKMGYMFNETYRFSVRGVFKDTGEYSPWFWVDDIRIDPQAINAGNPNDNRREQTGTTISNANGGIIDSYDLTSFQVGPFPTNRNIIIPHVEFFGANLDTTINGTPVSDLFEYIEFGRAEVIPEVLCTGIATLSVGFQGLKSLFYKVGNDFDPFTVLNPQRAMCYPFTTIPTGGNQTIGHLIQLPEEDNIENRRFEYPFVYGPPYMAGNNLSPVYPNIQADDQTPIYQYSPQNDQFFGDTVLLWNDRANVSPFTPWKSDRQILSIYSPDILYGRIDDISGYQLLDFGEAYLPTSTADEPQFNRTNNLTGAMYSQGSKYFAENLGTNFNLYEIENWKDIGAGEVDYIGEDKEFSKGFGVAYRREVNQPLTPIDGSHHNVGGPVIYVDNNGDGVTPLGKNLDYGVRYVQVYKEAINKYCSKEKETYYTTGFRYRLTRLTTTQGMIDQDQLRVFGGDTFTQATYLKGRYLNFDALEANGLTSWSDANYSPGDSPGFGGVVKFYSQNRVNSQMRYDTEDQFLFLSDTTSVVRWGEEAKGQIDQLTYSSKYNSSGFEGLLQPSYETVEEEKKDHPNRIEYSERKLYSSRIDEYLNRPPLNIKDLDATFGEITDHKNVGGELFTIQPRKFQLQYFNTRGTLQGSNEGVEVLIGDASVLSRDGQTLSSYGTQHKWSVVKGSSPGGKDVIYWFNQENGLFMRFGADGTVVISERHGLRSFSANNTRWTENQHVPALNYGIRSVWDDRFKEAIWTFIGLRSSQGEWGTLPSNQLYAQGDTVTNNTFINYPFDGVPDVYVSLSLHATIPQSEPGVGNDWETYWRRVDRDDPEYYSVFTIAFNELSNGFSTFYSHLPKTYLKWNNKFLSSHPTERSEIYEHRYGYDKWYEYDGVWKESEPFLEGVVNPFPDQSKKFVAIQALSDNVPDRIEFTTKDHESFLVSADFDPEDDAWRSPVKNDILTSPTGNPNDDTESLVGAYMRVKFKFFNGAYNKLNNLIVKVRQRLRRTQS